MPELAETPTGVPTPALITRAVHNLAPFSTIEILDLGLTCKPQHTQLYNFDMKPSESISKGANINAKEIVFKGMEFGRSYELKGNYLILGESTPSGTTTAAATTQALGYDLMGCFSSSFLHAPNDIKNHTINEALSHLDEGMDKFEKLSHVSDNMLLFCAGFILEATKRFHVVLGGGTQMAAALLVADALKEELLLRVNSDNLTLATTQWVAKDKDASLETILSQLSYIPHAIYTTFSFQNSQIPVLKKYDEGEAKEGVGAGASLAYGVANTLDNDETLKEIEYLLYTFG